MARGIGMNCELCEMALENVLSLGRVALQIPEIDPDTDFQRSA
jgi:hypothetical protein